MHLLQRSYQPKPESKEHRSYNSHHKHHTTQVNMNRTVRRIHSNSIDNIDNFVFDAYSKKKNHQNHQYRDSIYNEKHWLLTSQTTGKAVTTKMNTDMTIPQDATRIIDKDFHLRIIHNSTIEPSTLDPAPASTQTKYSDYQHKPEDKENHSYNPIHHRHINQVIINSISHGNHRNIIGYTDNLVHDEYCKRKKTRDTSDLSNRTSQHRLTGHLSLRQAL